MLGVWQSSERIFLITVKESFVALIPFIVVNSSLSLILALVDAWKPVWQQSENYIWFSQFSVNLHAFFPFLVLLSLSIHFAKYLNLSPVVLASLSIGTLISLHVHPIDTIEVFDHFSEMLTDPWAVVIPIFMAYTLKKVTFIKSLNFIKTSNLNGYLKLHLNLLAPMVISFLIVTLLILVSSFFFEFVFDFIVSHLQEAGNYGFVLFRVVTTHLLWCVGVHGDIAFHLFMGSDQGLQQVFQNLTIDQFMDIFILFGGSGGTMALIIAIFISSKDNGSLNVAKIALPFSFFNINEILIYGLPITFNPKLIIPFVLLPCMNMLLGYFAISWGLLTFNGHSVAWITPPLLNAYIASESFTVVAFQAGLIGLNVMLYLPFVRRFEVINTGNSMFENVLEHKIQLQTEFARISELNYVQKQSEELAADNKLQKTIQEVLSGELLLHYQPKICLDTDEVIGFEALLRLRVDSGKVVGPYFIKEFDDAGFANLIDNFVIKTVSEDLLKWQAEGFNPKVSINLNPNNILEKQTQNLLIDMLGSMAHNVEIELLESAFMLDLKRVEETIDLLSSYGFSFVLDDFGTGFSSLSLLSKIRVNGVKLDRSILEHTVDPKGQTLYKHTCMLCKSLGFNLIAEGVETKEEADFVKQAGVDCIQGWLYAKAMPMQEAKKYAQSIDKH
ncbi:EAL domain-containing protein [Shewanella woodyi]|uniref:Diguanylate phosphodiesterase n=1 Tax=Shewanella woodyi (strain ATCC 51908 / MS32) TaxID=392500 RepID=B1KGL6_SHEWM|nr:EAL domain-containing protein [Shewanella woodyi]ACA85344.1 diguanylate phosphodiesterase [Shewanella woodyi ATCC 51908]